MQLGYTIIYVADVPASLAFYGKAFGLATRFLHESNTYGELETGATALAFAAHAKALAAGATELKGPLLKPWGQTVSYVRCPDGSVVELCSPVGS
jgi:lactoylglutathione lyase